MEERLHPELGEPNEALKQEFRKLILENIPEDDESAHYILPDGRTLNLHRSMDPIEGDAAIIEETILNSNGKKISNFTHYDIYPDGKLRKMVNVDDEQVGLELTPEERADIVLAEAEAKPWKDLVTAAGASETEARLEETITMIKNNETVANIVGYSLLKMAYAHTEDEKLGLQHVNAVDLQNIIGIIKSAVENDPQTK